MYKENWWEQGTGPLTPNSITKYSKYRLVWTQIYCKILNMAKFCGSTAKFLTNPCKHLQNFYKKKTQLKQIYGYSEYSVDFECCRNEK